MRVFVSYSREDRDRVEPVVHALRNEGHDVFFDVGSLEPGRAYHDRIRSEIARSELFVFFASVHSTRPGCYAMAEVEIAKDLWPAPKTRVLPVRLDDVPLDRVPHYLRAVTVLDPSGALEPAIGLVVEKRVRAIRRRRLAYVGGLAAALGAFGAAWAFGISPLAPSPKVEVTSVVPGYVDPFSGRWSAAVEGTVDNPGATSLFLTGIRVAGADGAKGEAVLDECDLETPVGQRSRWRARVSGSGASNERWSVIYETAGGELRSAERDASELMPKDGPTILPEALGRRARYVVASGSGFVVATADPHELVELDRDGSVVGSRSLSRAPTALAANDGTVAVGLDDGTVALRRGDDPDRVEEVPDGKNGLGEPYSDVPSSMAFDDGTLWITTRGPSGESAILALETSGWIRPPYFDGYEPTSAADLRLRSYPGPGVLAVNTNTTPSSVYVLRKNEYVEYGGHDHDVVSAASDVVAFGAGFALRDDEDRVVAVLMEPSRLRTAKDLGRLRFPWEARMSVGRSWIDYRIAAAGEEVVVAVSLFAVDSSAKLWTGVASPRANEAMTTRLEFEAASTRDLAAQSGRVLVLLEDEQGRTALVLQSAR